MPVRSWRHWVKLQQAAHQARSALEEEAASLELRLVEMNVLVNVAYEPGLTATALAGVSGIKASTLNGVIDKLEDAGLLERKRDNDDDRREVSLHLTPEGSERADQARNPMTRYGKWLASKVTPEDLQAFHRVLSTIAPTRLNKASSA